MVVSSLVWIRSRCNKEETLGNTQNVRMDGGGVTLSLTEKKKKEKMKNERNNAEGWANQQRNLNEGNNSNKMQNSAGKLKEVTASHSLHSEDSVEKLPPKRRIPC